MKTVRFLKIMSYLAACGGMFYWAIHPEKPEAIIVGVIMAWLLEARAELHELRVLILQLGKGSKNDKTTG